MAKRSPDPIDATVGNRLRERRVLIGMSQEKLGDRLGLTFQQVQKYEKGLNRVSASRLYQMAEILGVKVQYFYNDAESTPAGVAAAKAAAGEVSDAAAAADGLQLSQAFMEISSPEVRRRIIDLVRAIAAA